MRGNQFGAQRESDMQAFERLLKTSPHFADVMNTHRRAAAAVSAQVFALLIAKGQLELQSVLDTLHDMDRAYGTSSDGAARRLSAAMVRDELAALTRGM